MTIIHTLPHPTPLHIRQCIQEALADYDAKARHEGRDPLPIEVWGIVRSGIAVACAEHERDGLHKMGVEI